MSDNNNVKQERFTSRIGDMPVILKENVSVDFKNGVVTVKGPKGTLTENIPAGIEVKIDNGVVTFINKLASKKIKNFHGLARALVANMVQGVFEPFKKELVVEGIGYKFEKKGSDISVTVGYSNPVVYNVPSDVEVNVAKDKVSLEVIGIDKARVGHIASEIRIIRPPEPYKGKGIRYKGEHINRKVGKSGA